jgi:hypothetical protein
VPDEIRRVDFYVAVPDKPGEGARVLAGRARMVSTLGDLVAFEAFAGGTFHIGRLADLHEPKLIQCLKESGAVCDSSNGHAGKTHFLPPW